MRKFLYILTLMFFSSPSFSEGWDTFGKHENLKDYVIAEVGDIAEIRPPMGERWSVDLYKINSRCLAFSSYIKPTFYSSKAALLLMKEPSTVSLAIFEDSISSIKVDVYAVKMYECPYGSSPVESLEILQRKLKQQLENLNQKKIDLEKLQRSEPQ